MGPAGLAIYADMFIRRLSERISEARSRITFLQQHCVNKASFDLQTIVQKEDSPIADPALKEHEKFLKSVKKRCNLLQDSIELLGKVVDDSRQTFIEQKESYLDTSQEGGEETTESSRERSVEKVLIGCSPKVKVTIDFLREFCPVLFETEARKKQGVSGGKPHLQLLHTLLLNVIFSSPSQMTEKRIKQSTVFAVSYLCSGD